MSTDARLEALEKMVTELRAREQNNLLAIGASLSGQEAFTLSIMAAIATLGHTPRPVELVKLVEQGQDAPFWRHYLEWQQVMLYHREQSRRFLQGQLAIAGPSPSEKVH